MRETYDDFALIYDEFTSANRYGMWLGELLLPELAKRGLRKGRVLEVGCGTGKAFKPMLDRGWEVEGSDLSPGMLAKAHEKYGDTVSLHRADLCALPVLGEFDLVWALNGVTNLLLGDADLELALAGMRANLGPGGLILFDADTAKLFSSLYGEGNSHSLGPEEQWNWVGAGPEFEPGGTFDARISGPRINGSLTHRSRHRTGEEIRVAMAVAGLESVAAIGQEEDENEVVLNDDHPNEERDWKIIHIARAA